MDGQCNIWGGPGDGNIEEGQSYRWRCGRNVQGKGQRKGEEGGAASKIIQ